MQAIISMFTKNANIRLIYYFNKNSTIDLEHRGAQFGNC